MDAGTGPRPLRGPHRHRRIPGRSEEFDRSITGFSERYASQNEQDYQQFLKAIKSGRLQATEGV
jgi:hypothetical protein